MSTSAEPTIQPALSQKHSGAFRDYRKAERQELIAASLASGMIAARGEDLTPQQVVWRYREVLIALRKEF